MRIYQDAGARLTYTANTSLALRGLVRYDPLDKITVQDLPYVNRRVDNLIETDYGRCTGTADALVHAMIMQQWYSVIDYFTLNMDTPECKDALKKIDSIGLLGALVKFLKRFHVILDPETGEIFDEDGTIITD